MTKQLTTELEREAYTKIMKEIEGKGIEGVLRLFAPSIFDELEEENSNDQTY